jgi:hypothetical protein
VLSRIGPELVNPLLHSTPDLEEKRSLRRLQMSPTTMGGGGKKSSKAANIFDQLNRGEIADDKPSRAAKSESGANLFGGMPEGLYADKDDTSEVPTTVIFRESTSRGKSNEGPRNAKAVPKPPRAGGEARSPRVMRSKAPEERGAYCHEFTSSVKASKAGTKKGASPRIVAGERKGLDEEGGEGGLTPHEVLPWSPPPTTCPSSDWSATCAGGGGGGGGGCL